jgi:ABC-type bacteriocin/lantibiotic exporter with double-glycine peptidase domain
MSFTFQDFAKYYMTIEDNIKFSDLENHTHKDVSRFAQMNDTDEFINALPEGYQQRLGRMFNKSTD